jgi:hypothetical protein
MLCSKKMILPSKFNVKLFRGGGPRFRSGGYDFSQGGRGGGGCQHPINTLWPCMTPIMVTISWGNHGECLWDNDFMGNAWGNAWGMHGECMGECMCNSWGKHGESLGNAFGTTMFFSKILMTPSKILMDTLQNSIGHPEKLKWTPCKIIMDTCKIKMGTYKMQVMHKFVLVRCNNGHIFSIHKHMRFPAVAIAIIDTPQFQRLRFLKQVGSCHFVYPSATHTRFQHSLGVGYLAYKYANKLRLANKGIVNEKDCICVMIAGLCHDLGM